MKQKNLIALLLAVVLLLTGCASAPKAPEIAPVEDIYRNYYEVFVWSFADSDADGIGDLKGLEGKLDYIYDMGFNGIWLMPIMPSPSYHKYDVTDYCAIDPQYGTMEDFRALVDAAHEKGIRIIIDLVVNHSSNEHPWFQAALEDVDSPYRDYYVWSDEIRDGFNPSDAGYYESRFYYGMPDLNLDNPKVREEIEKIMAFWLQDAGVDGFRLDAVTSYYTGSIEKNTEFMDWLSDTAHGMKEDCYIVGEAWTGFAEIGEYSVSAIDSLFTFPVAQQSGFLAQIVSDAAATPGETYGKLTLKIDEVLAPHSIPAAFLGNHDTTRPANFLGRNNPERMKLAAGLMAMLPGNPFVYYGEEIGMLGNGEDPNKRISMYWSDEVPLTQDPPGTTESGYHFPSVAVQQEDEASIWNYYRDAMWLRHANPEIARGETEVLPSPSTDICLLRRTWGEGSVIIALNPSHNDHTVEAEGELTGTLSAKGLEVTLKDGILTLPSYSIAILR